MSVKLTFVIVLFCLLKTVSLLSVEIPAFGNECFYEELEKNEKLTISYQVTDQDNVISFYVTNPNSNSIIMTNSKEEQGTFNVNADIAGKYTFCFSNIVSGIQSKSVSFNAYKNEKITAQDNAEDPLRSEIEELANSIFDIKAKQEYLVARERRHRDTVESTNDRVKWWSLAQIGLLFGVCFWQVYYLRHFFSVKRTV